MGCQNGGLCQLLGVFDVRGREQYRCVCDENYVGRHCQHVIERSSLTEDGEYQQGIISVCIMCCMSMHNLLQCILISFCCSLLKKEFIFCCLVFLVFKTAVRVVDEVVYIEKTTAELGQSIPEFVPCTKALLGFPVRRPSQFALHANTTTRRAK